MERSELKLIVTSADAEARARASKHWALALGPLLLLGALAATSLGADQARRPIESREVARRTILRAMQAGSEDPEVRSALLTLRGELGQRPLDARTRAIYATLLLGASREEDDTRAAAFHADRAAELAPVTVPVIRYAVHVLVRAGDPDRGLGLTREMFRYDARSAAELLSQVEGFLSAQEVEQALPETPEAWLAWSGRLGALRRRDEADEWLTRAHQRWPNDLTILEKAASRAYAARGWGDLRRVFRPGMKLPEEPSASRLFCYRARLKAEEGNAPGARADLETALRLGGYDVATLELAADVLEVLGDAEAARRHWMRALFLLRGKSSDSKRVRILVRLARLEDREGSPATALRTWRLVLEIQPNHVEARRRVDDLAGFRR